MRAIRAIAAAAVVIAAAVTIYDLCIPPLRCSILEHEVEDATLQLVQFEGGVSVAAHARDNLSAVKGCMRARPTDINLYMIAAANCRLLGDNQAAVDFYKQALRYDQRPELFVNLGNTESAIGQRSEAIENLVKANLFWPGNGDEIEDPFVHDEVMRRVRQYESAQKSLSR